MAENNPVSDIIDEAGVERIIAASRHKLSRWALYKWPRIGIPEKHWPLVIELTGRSPNELHDANERARAMAATRAAA